MTETTESSPAHVLIVDDNAQNLELLEVYLEEMEEVRTTQRDQRHRGAGGDQPGQARPDPARHHDAQDERALNCASSSRGNPATRDIIIIMVTALNETADIERATECGTDDYLTKPIDRKALIELIRSQLQAARARR
jgi:two-component system alkaline phosphatase synthesis response regulator PhoP